MVLVGHPTAYVVAALVATLAVLSFPVGIRRYRPRQAMGWWLLLAGVVLHTLGAITWVVTGIPVYSNGHVGLPNVMHVLAYACLAAGALMLLGRRRFRDDPAEALDALVITAAIGVAAWGLILRPLGASISLDGGVTAMITAYPLFALATVGCAAQLWLASSGTKNVSMRLVVGALGALVVANILQSAQVLGDGQTWQGGLVVAVRLLFPILLAMAVLHPSMASTTVLPPSRSARSVVALRPRSPILAGIAPLSIVIADSLLDRPTGLPRACSSAPSSCSEPSCSDWRSSAAA